MNSKNVIALAAIAAVLVLAGSLLWVTSAGTSDATPPVTAGSDTPTQETGAPPIVALDEERERESLGTTDEVDSQESGSGATAASEKGRAPSDTILGGRVLDTQGRPVAGVGIFVGSFPSDPARGIRRRTSTVFGTRRLGSGGAEDGTADPRPSTLFPKPTQRIGQSGKAGRFEIPRLPDGSLLHARAEGYVPVLSFDWYGSDPGDPEAVLVVAAPSAVAGVVIDEHGNPIEGVEVAVLVPDTLRPSLGLILDRAEPLEYFSRSGSDGRFEIADAPGVEGRQLVATRGGSPSEGQPISAEPETSLKIVLQLGQEIRAAARGTVLDMEGKPVPDANVRLGDAHTRTAADGRFVLDATAAQPGREILAAKPGFTPGYGVFDPQVENLVLRIGRPTSSLAGRVIDGKGRPIASVEVRALGLRMVGGIALEDLATLDGPGPFTHCETDAEGRFAIGGLEARAYSLGLVDKRSMRTMQSDPIQAGKSDAEIRFAAGDLTGRIAGTVVDRAGKGVSGAEVWLIREIVRDEIGQPSRMETFAKANAEGAFEFPDVALDVSSARVAFPSELGFEYRIEAGQDLGHLVFVAYGRAHLQVDLSGSDLPADDFGIVDEDGNALPIAKYEGSTAMSSMRWPITDGRSDALAALDAAEAVVLYHKGAEISRIPVRLVPGELTVVRP